MSIWFLFCVRGGWSPSCFSKTIFLFYRTPTSLPNFIVYLFKVHNIFPLLHCTLDTLLKFLNSNDKENFVNASWLKEQIIFHALKFGSRQHFIAHSRIAHVLLYFFGNLSLIPILPWNIYSAQWPVLPQPENFWPQKSQCDEVEENWVQRKETKYLMNFDTAEISEYKQLSAPQKNLSFLTYKIKIRLDATKFYSSLKSLWLWEHFRMMDMFNFMAMAVVRLLYIW